MTTPRFDKSKDYGQVTPADDGAHYWQNGHYFGLDNGYLRSDDAGVKGAVKAAPVAPAADEPHVGEEDKSVDLIAWAKKEKNYPFFSVKKAMEEAYPNSDTSTTKAIVAALIEAGSIGADEAKR